MKRLPSLTQSQRRALLVIEWVLLIGIVGYSLWKTKTPQPHLEGETQGRERRGALAKPFSYAEKEEEVEAFPFDPNTADSTALLRLGLSPWQVRSIYRYRAKHGRYNTPDDFKRVPNMTVEQWERLKPYIQIAPQFRYVEPAPQRAQPQSVPVESPSAEVAEANQNTFPKQEKIGLSQTIDINTADTSQLKMIPGIASKRAARIVAYRKALGGFVAVEQAMEAVEMPDTVLHYMTLSPVEVTKINVNKLSVQQLMKHPYLNFYQAKAIFEHRRNKGDLQSIEDLKHLDAFRPSDIDRLQPYIEF